MKTDSKTKMAYGLTVSYTEGKVTADAVSQAAMARKYETGRGCVVNGTSFNCDVGFVFTDAVKRMDTIVRIKLALGSKVRFERYEYVDL